MEATYIDPENAEVNWTPAITGGNPAYYEVLVGKGNPFNPEEGYFGEYSFETANTSLNLPSRILYCHLAVMPRVLGCFTLQFRWIVSGSFSA